MFHAFFKRKEKQAMTQPQTSTQFVFRDNAVIDVTFFDAMTPEDPLGYLYGGIVQLSSDGHLVIYSDTEKRILEEISVIDIISGSNNINNHDSKFLTDVSLITNKKEIRISFRDEAVKREFWNALTSVYDNARACTDSGTPEFSHLVGYKYSVTGSFGYSFLHGNEEIVTVSSHVIPNPPITILGNGIVWESPCFADTIVPGVSRYVIEQKTKRVVSKITFIERGQYQLNDSVHIYCETDKSVFYRDDRLIAGISRCQEKKLSIPASLEPHRDWQPYYEISVSQNVDNELLTLICAFPMLRFFF